MYRIVHAELKHLKDVSELFDQYRQFYNKEYDLTGATEFIKERIVKADSVIFACYNDQNEITGFVQLYPLFSSTRMKKLWLLNDLFVIEKHRGKGVSHLLISKSKELCKATGACGLTLETAKTNKQGNRLYPATGFKLAGESNFYNWDVEDN